MSTPTKSPAKTDKPIKKPSPPTNPGLSSNCSPSEADLKLNLRLLHALDGSIAETPAATSSDPKPKGPDENWSVMEDQELDLDLSFVAAADAVPTPATPPAPTETDTPKAKSRLPMIKKHLRRLSFQKTPTELKPVTPLVVNKKNPRPSVPASPSPTRLPAPAAKGALRATFASSGKKVSKRMSRSAT